MAEIRGAVGGPVLTTHFGTTDLHRLKVYERLGGYEGLRKAQKMQPSEITQAVKDSGLRGRSSSFPSGTKWGFMPLDIPGPRYVLVNADESEPGCTKDRFLMENSPHMLVEGILIAGLAVKATEAWIYIRGEYDLQYTRLHEAIEEARAKGYLHIDIRLYKGHGAYICGEETALLESIEGKRGQPRSRPPFPVIRGAWGRPTLNSNVETFCTVPWIIQHGAAEYTKFGTAKSPGTRVFTLSGDIQRPGNYERELGKPFRELIMEFAGGPRPGRKVKAFWPGGSSMKVLPASLIDTTTDLEALAAVDSMGGSGGVIVVDDSRCMFKLAHRLLQFYARESCGKCTPCRVGGDWAVRTFERVLAGQGSANDLEIFDRIQHSLQNGRCLCGLGDSAGWVIVSTMRHFRSEYEEHCLRNECSVEAAVAHA